MSFTKTWAENGTKREPTTTEWDQGFTCGPADPELFNDLFNKASLSGFRPGMIVSSLDVTVEGFLLCDGSTVSRTDFANLFAIPAAVAGFGDGLTTFEIPDLRGMFLRGFDNGRGVDAGRALGSYQEDTIQNITGTFMITLMI